MPLKRCLIILALAATALAQDDGEVAKDAEVVPSNIESVISGGYWSRDGRDGTFRLIIEVMGWDPLYSRAFLQWIATDQDNQKTIVERTVPIKEIAGRWRISSQKFVRGSEPTRIVITTTRYAPPGKATFTITPAADYSYKIVISEK